MSASEAKAPFKTLFEYCQSDVNLELAVRAIARRKGKLTADDLHVLDFSLLKLGRKRQVYGAILAKLVKDGFLRKVGYVASSRETCHNRPVLLFECLEASR